ncbi:MAG: transcriptional regulator [Betaproteobacteria bacterium HGW-Betaproteobacteria-11]|nr:MAG: transcriptional regulator [Betaproteobacteria bacterium HGW-Betaproteobacteria-11]
MKTQSFNFDTAPASALVTIAQATALMSRSRASVYRHNKSGELPFVKLGKSTRIRVGDLRRLIGAAQ